MNHGLIRTATGTSALQSIPIPALPPSYILVKVAAVAINPTDWTTLEAPGANGTLAGCDWAGTILAVGSHVTKDLRVGERVCGVAHGANDARPETGAFAEIIISKGDLAMRIPAHVSFEEAATAGVAVATVGLGLYKHLGLPLPGSGPGFDVLVYGGSTATGTIAIQFAKLSGCTVYTTCSEDHFSLAKSRGADYAFDYRTPNVGEQIHTLAPGLMHAFDTVSLPSTASICASALAGGTYVNLLGENCPRDDVTSIYFLGYGISGEEYIFEGETYAASPSDFTFGRDFLALAERLWAEKKWQTHPVSLQSGGLHGLQDGMQQLKEGKVRGMKLVYSL